MPLTQNYELSDIPKVQPEGYSTFRALCFVEVMAKIFIRIVHIHLITSITIERKLETVLTKHTNKTKNFVSTSVKHVYFPGWTILYPEEDKGTNVRNIGAYRVLQRLHKKNSSLTERRIKRKRISRRGRIEIDRIVVLYNVFFRKIVTC